MYVAFEEAFTPMCAVCRQSCPYEHCSFKSSLLSSRGWKMDLQAQKLTLKMMSPSEAAGHQLGIQELRWYTRIALMLTARLTGPPPNSISLCYLQRPQQTSSTFGSHKEERLLVHFCRIESTFESRLNSTWESPVEIDNRATDLDLREVHPKAYLDKH